MKLLVLAAISAALVITGPGFAQTGPVPPNTLNYGPGRIDASTAWRYLNQQVTACGRAAHTHPQAAFLVMGMAPYETVIDFPSDIDPRDVEFYSFKMICVSGFVAEGALNGLRRAAIEIDDMRQIEVIGGTGMYQPPTQGCKPWEALRNGVCTPWRAHPYGK